ncbi:MAG: DUF1684 domain-containing protein [Thermoanaerobaculia bacterium]
MRRAALALVLVLAPAACRRPPAVDPAYVAEIGTSRALRETRLRSENGWLTLVALHWLAPGENLVGSDPAAAVSLGETGLPPRACAFVLGPDGRVTLHAEPGAPVAVNGAPPSAAPLATDRDGKPDVVTVGRARLTVIERGGRLALRARDPESPRRTAFAGLDYFPVDTALRVEGTFARYDAPREIEVPSAQGPAQKATAPGVVRFELRGKKLELEPTVESPTDDTFFFVFGDATNGDGSYGAGRFLYAPVPKAGDTKVVLDFNLAQNPPCAFTPYATCPLPLPKNVLPLRVEGGEKAPAGH